MNVPTTNECYELFRIQNTPLEIVRHSEANRIVGEMIHYMVPDKISLEEITAATLTHDIGKTIDENGNYHNGDHLETGKQFLTEQGFPELGDVISKHGFIDLPKTDLEKATMYSDQRTLGEEIVSLSRRFNDINLRYKFPSELRINKAYQFVKQIEEDLGFDGTLIK